MDPFNIIVNLDSQKFDLNIHPQESEVFKILYHGGLVGEIIRTGKGSWRAVSVKDLDPDLEMPMYEYDGSIDDVRIILQGDHAQLIGQAIDNYQGA
ncbi:hypothetical protein SAMN06265348_101238 [Pedobacter westerhofensis]|uniref:Uncharacterized protein n=1 Tax=Pedobacter westerhofensis TaxID=425512 RepID=A0A521AIR6_9SPHI|nr:hypothetical protein [Pedobacter westerhofensis]SMO34667.1 hypothetical protein SAMN06265348_101238 [Pedobacter westerhofensis]